MSILLKYLSVIVLTIGFLLVASTVSAASLSYTSDTTVSLTSPAIDLTIKSGSVSNNFTVDTGSVTVVVPAGSRFDITSASKALTASGVTSAANISQICSSGTETTTIMPGGVDETITLTPGSSQCTTTTSNTGGGGGGGGGGSVVTTTPTPASSTTGTITATPAAGGITTYTPADTSTPTLKVTVPASAVSSNATVSVTSTTLNSEAVSSPVTSGAASGMVGQPLKLTATSGSISVTSFSKPLTLVFTYTDAQLAGTSESDLAVMFYNTATAKWEEISSTIDAVNNIVTAQVSHLSVFVLVSKVKAAVTPEILSPLSGAAAASGAHPNGTLVIDGSTIYLIQSGARAAFRDANEYKSHGYNFGQAVAVNNIDKGLSVQSIQKALVGTLVLDSSDNRTVYMIGSNDTKRGFTSEAVFKQLGYSFKGLLKINLSDYTTGAVISSGTEAHPDGALVLEGKTVWWIRSGQRSGFESEAVFKTYGFSFDRVVTANAADLSFSAGSNVKFRDGTLVKQSGAVYLISDGKKLVFNSMNALTSRGYKASNAISAVLTNYESGESLN